MTLSLVFRIQALVFAFFGVFMLIAPGAMMETFAGPGQYQHQCLLVFCKICLLMVLAMAYLSWQMPNWVGDNLKTVGMVYVYYSRGFFGNSVLSFVYWFVSIRCSKHRRRIA